MKRIISAIMICCSFSMEMYTQSDTKARVLETTVDLNPYEYQIKQYDWSPYTPEVSFIEPTKDSRYRFIKKGNVGEPDIPWVAVILPVDEKENFSSFTYTIEETSVRDTFLVSPIDALITGDMGDGEDEDSILVKYPDEDFPKQQVMYISTLTSSLNNEVKKSIVLHVCPFRYDARENILQLLKVHLKVTVGEVSDGIYSTSERSINHQSFYPHWSDLSGRHLNSAPTHPGLYIKDGRKVVAK